MSQSYTKNKQKHHDNKKQNITKKKNRNFNDHKGCTHENWLATASALRIGFMPEAELIGPSCQIGVLVSKGPSPMFSLFEYALQQKETGRAHIRDIDAVAAPTTALPPQCFRGGNKSLMAEQTTQKKQHNKKKTSQKEQN